MASQGIKKHTLQEPEGRANVRGMAALMESSFKEGQLKLRVLCDRVDAVVTPEFKRQCDAAWNRGTKSLEVDLNTVNFIDSSGVGAILGLFKKMSADHPDVKLTGVKPEVQEILELLRLHRIFQIEPA